jgi:DNA-binding LacI/PurR family transcriptional regulator
VEGLIVASEQPENCTQVFDGLNKKRVPFVLVDRYFPGRDFPAVLVDDMSVGRMATEHLVDLGHRRIGHLRGPRLSPASLRYKGYVRALKSHNLQNRKEWIQRGNFDVASGCAAMRRILAAKNRPSAVFAANDPMAIGALYACREAGLRVPEDISIVGAGNIEGADHPNPFLTTVDWPRQELGRTAAHYLIHAIQNPNTDRSETARKVFLPRLLVRQSTAPSAGS